MNHKLVRRFGMNSLKVDFLLECHEWLSFAKKCFYTSVTSILLYSMHTHAEAFIAYHLLCITYCLAVHCLVFLPLIATYFLWFIPVWLSKHAGAQGVLVDIVLITRVTSSFVDLWHVNKLSIWPIFHLILSYLLFTLLLWLKQGRLITKTFSNSLQD